MKLGDGVAAGGGCEMSMAVWADGGLRLCCRRASAWLKKISCAIWGLCWRNSHANTCAGQ